MSHLSVSDSLPINFIQSLSYVYYQNEKYTLMQCNVTEVGNVITKTNKISYRKFIKPVVFHGRVCQLEISRDKT